jgi:hypothetical protein
VSKLVRFISVIGIVTVGSLGVVAYKTFESHNSPSQPNPIAKSLPVVELSLDSSTPSNNSSGESVLISASPSSDISVQYVLFLLDNKQVGIVYTPPYELRLDTSVYPDGSYELQVVVYDTDGNSTKSDVVLFNIDNQSNSQKDTRSDDTADKDISEGASTVAYTDPGLMLYTQPTTKDIPQEKVDKTAPPVVEPPVDSTSPPANARAAGGWWSVLPQFMKVCDSQLHLEGPSTAPVGAIIIPAGNNSGVSFNAPDTVYWFEPGVHILGEDEYSQVIPGAGSSYIGAPGAVIDGQSINRYAFGGSATNVTIQYLEIRNFGRGNDNNNEGVINHDAATNWTMDHLFAHNNDGAAVFMGSQNTLSNSCVSDNGQYGFSMFKPPVVGDSAIKDIVITNNEISGNNTDDWEAQLPGCGCSGGGKFWDVKGATITNNYVHNNKGTGLWADTNNIDFLFDSNWIEGNDGEGIWYEISYNVTISRNVLKSNAWIKGQANTGAPAPAIYLSESAGDSRLDSSVSGSTNLQVKNNLIEDNFSGITIYENSNRFCNSNGNTSKTYCTPFVSPGQISEPYNDTYPNPISSTHPCYTNIASAPYLTDCRWHAKNVKVFNNEFRFDKNVVPCAGNYCGAQSLLATGSDNIPWAPAEYAIAAIQNKVLFMSGNNFYNNNYYGEWKFTKAYGETISRYGWQAGPYNQDTGSTFIGGIEYGNQLDDNSATLEGSLGSWTTWFGAAVSRTDDTAHTGVASLKIDIEGQYWGVNLNNYPGVSSWPGEHRVSYWAKKSSVADSVGKMVLLIDWKDSSGANLKEESDRVPIATLTTDWQYAEAILTAPAGTEYVYVSIADDTGAYGDTVYVDDVNIRHITP